MAIAKRTCDSSTRRAPCRSRSPARSRPRSTVWVAKRSPRSRVTLSIAQCALRTSAPGSPCGSDRPAPAPRRPRATGATGSGTGPRCRRRTSRRPRPGGRRRGCSSAPCPRRSAPRSSLGRDHVALRLGHLRAVAGDHALGEQAVERLLHVEQLHVRQRLDEEARVHQVQDRVLHAADVLVDGHPALQHLAVPRRLVVVGVAVAQEVPGRVDEGVHRVGLALGRAAALRARRCSPSPRPPPAATGPWARSPRPRAARPAAGRRAPARARSRGSARSGSGSPSSAGARAASRAGGS